MGNLTALYNVTNFTSWDCTDPSTPIDPHPLIAICNNFDGLAYMKPPDSINFTLMGPIWFYADTNDTSNVNASELTSVPCSTTMLSGWSCTSAGGAYWQGQRIGTWLSPGSNVFAPYVGQACTSEPNGAPSRSICRGNRLYRLNTLTLEYTPFFLENDVTASVPCIFDRLDGYDCQANNTAVASNGSVVLPLIYYYNNSALENQTVPCIQNNATAMPQCRQIEVQYQSGLNATIVVQGVSVRYYINDERIELRCTAPVVNGISSLAPNATMEARVNAYYGDFGGT